jgi:hypothetical protein
LLEQSCVLGLTELDNVIGSDHGALASLKG